MITKAQRKTLKKYLKDDYLPEVQAYMEAKKIVSRNGNIYSDSTIRNVLNGIRKNHAIKDSLLAIYLKRKLQAEQFDQALKNKKPEAATSGS